MTIDQFLYEHPVFRYEEFIAWKTQKGKIKASSVNTALRYFIKTGRIKLIRRKLYAAIPPNQTAESLTVDSYLIAGKATEDAVLSYHTALELMGIAYSTFGQFSYLTQQKSKPFEFNGQWYQSVSVPKALQKIPDPWVGVTLMNRQGVMLKVTNAERTFVDVLDRIELSGGWEEVCRSIANMAVLNIEEVIRYCLMLKNACLNAKVGYFLSQRQGAFAVSEKQLKPLLAAKPKIPQHASKAGHESFQLIKPWNILLPVFVVNQSWVEHYANMPMNHAD